jgi:hypothetical protein
MLHRIKTVLLLCVFCFILVLSGCGGSKTADPSPQPSQVADPAASTEQTSSGSVSSGTEASDAGSNNTSSGAAGSAISSSLVLKGAGNTPSNLLLGGLTAEYDGYVYHVDSMMWGNIWRPPQSGGDGELLQMGRFNDLNVSGGAIFALGSAVDPATGSSADGIYRMYTDGSDVVLVREGYFSQLVLYDEYLYYTDDTEGKLSRIKYDGSGETLLSEGRVDDFTVIDGVLYLYAELDVEYEMNIYEMPLDGSGALEMVVHDTFGGAICAANGYIFYIPRQDNSSNMWVYDTATGEASVFMTEWMDDVNTDGEYLYYTWTGRRLTAATRGCTAAISTAAERRCSCRENRSLTRISPAGRYSGPATTSSGA